MAIHIARILSDSAHQHRNIVITVRENETKSVGDLRRVSFIKAKNLLARRVAAYPFY
jgi:hypothetical protein